MAYETWVLCDEETPLESLIERFEMHTWALDEGQVAFMETARAKEGEAWSPQLLAYDEWKATQGEEVPEADLLQVGFMTGFMAWENEERDRLVARALAEGETAQASSSAVLTPEGAKTGRPFMVRPVEGGYALVGVDVRMLSEQVGAHSMVLALPTHVGGVPIVRITAEAFARRYVRGVDVRLLVIPDTVAALDANALGALSVRHVHVGAGIGLPFTQPCSPSSVAPRLETRTYSVAANNAWLSAREGSLYAEDGVRLLFWAPPYGSRAAIPAGVQRIEPAAFFLTETVPHVVEAPRSLEHVAPKEFDDAVWLCAPGAPARDQLAARGVRTAGENAVEQDNCWYDFGSEGAWLVAGPPAPKSASRTFAEAAAARVHGGAAPGQEAGAQPSPFEAVRALNAQAPVSDSLALPAQVAGRPLVRIGTRALPTAPSLLDIPSTVREIGPFNACKGTRHLALHEGLERIGAHSFCSRTLQEGVVLPASVYAVGMGCFEYAVCRLEKTGSVVHVSADQLKSCFVEHEHPALPFDFEAYDELLRQGATLPDGVGALLHRVADPCAPCTAVRDALCARLRSAGNAVLQRVAREGSVLLVKALWQAGFIDDSNFDAQIELLRQANRADCVLFLMEARGGGAAARKQEKVPSARSRFAL